MSRSEYLALDARGRFYALTERSSGCWLWRGPLNPQGYGYVFVGRREGNPRNRPTPAHRLSYELHKGPIPKGRMICHTCDNPPCVNPEHLYAGTAKDNHRDALERNRTRLSGGPIKRFLPPNS